MTSMCLLHRFYVYQPMQEFHWVVSLYSFCSHTLLRFFLFFFFVFCLFGWLVGFWLVLCVCVHFTHPKPVMLLACLWRHSP